jgi:HTH-type transcriptional regulator/antitoxin HigA
MTTREDLHSDLATPPGTFLQEVLDDLGMSQAELARRMGRPAQAINEIIKGQKELTPQTAIQLEQVVDVPAHIWLGLEGEYRLVRARQQEQQSLADETRFLDAFPYAEMAKLGCVRKVRRGVEKVQELRRFFRVSSLNQFDAIPEYALAFRQAAVVQGREISTYGLAAWLHCGELRASEIPTASFNKSGLKAAIPKIRALTTERPDNAIVVLRGLLADTGVAFVLFPHFPRTYTYGATFWPSGERAVLLLSVRGRYADLFWFNLLHEVGHILLHGNRLFVEAEGAASKKTPPELEADAFARDTLVPPDAYAALVSEGKFSTLAVRAFAESIGVDPGIVAGRLQHEERIGHDHLNGLRRLLELEPGD